MVVRILFAVLVLSTVAVVAVGLAIHLRVKRHLQDKAAGPAVPTSEVSGRDDTVAVLAPPDLEKLSGSAGKELSP